MKMISLKEDFIEQITQNYSSNLISNHIGENKSVSGKEILKMTKSRQINFFVIKILFQEWQEEMKKLESPYFNYKTADVRKAMVELMNILSQNIEVSAEDLKPLVEKAFYLTLLLYVNPAEYVIEELLEKRNGKLTDKLGNQLVKYLVYQKAEVKEFLGQVKGMPNNEVIELTSGYFEDYDSIEGLGMFVEEISDIVEANLEDFVLVEDSEKVQQEIVTDEVVPEEIKDHGELEEKVIEEESAETYDLTEDEVVETVFSRPVEQEEDEILTGSTETDTHEIEKETMIESEPGEEAVPTLNDKFTEEAKTLADVHEEKGVDSIMDAISINHKYMFLQELFDGDNEVFQRVIHEVEQQKSFDEAVEFLVQNYAKDFFWDMNSDEVKEFLKVIFRYFR